MHFMFKEEDHIVDCDVERLFKDVVEEFAKKVNEDLETIFFIFKGKKIDLSNYYNYVGQVFNLDFQKEKQRIDLLVFQENLFSIKFIYQGVNYIINAKLKEKMKIVFQKLEEKSEIILQNVIFQKSGDKFSAKEKEEIPIEQIANSYDKEENSMTILVYDLERNNSLANENLGRLLPQSEDNDSNYNNNNSINNNNSYENPKIYNEEDKGKNTVKKMKKISKLKVGMSSQVQVKMTKKEIIMVEMMMMVENIIIMNQIIHLSRDY